MIKVPIRLQELRKKIYVKAKAEKQWLFWGLYVHVCKYEVLMEAYKLAKQNNGAPGLDGVTFEEIEASGLRNYILTLQSELQTQNYKPIAGRKVKIPKADGKSHRQLTIPSIRDRIVQGAVKLILEPIFEADFKEGSYGYRPKRSPEQAIQRVTKAILNKKKTKVIDLDISKFFDTVRHDIMLSKIAKRVRDDKVLSLIKLILKASGKRGLPQGGSLSPLLSNVYLNSIDEMLEKAKEVTATNGYTNLEYVRWADDAVILVEGHEKQSWLVGALLKRVSEELDKLGLKLNVEKTKTVDLTAKENFEFLGFDFRLSKTFLGKIGVRKIPKRQARLKLQSTIKEIFRTKRARPIEEIVGKLNPMLRGWVNYFRIGNSSKCFGIVKRWVELKVRRHIRKVRQKQGIGWKQWSSQELYDYTKLFNDYRIVYNKG